MLWVFGVFSGSNQPTDKNQHSIETPKITGKVYVDRAFGHISRHPNYVGEVLLWTGIAVISFPTFERVAIPWLSYRLFFTYLLLDPSEWSEPPRGKR